MASGHRQTLASMHLNMIRGLAALVVVAGHARGLFFHSLTVPATAQAHGGPVPDPVGMDLQPMTIGDEAVMVFFVLSGFLVGGSVLRQMASGSWTWRDYIVRRLVRLWVVLIPVLFIGVAVDLFGQSFFAGAGSLYSAPADQGYVNAVRFADDLSWRVIVGNIFFLQSIFVPMPGTNFALWSLAYEFWYYMAFPAGVIALSSRFKIGKRVFFGLSCLGILIMIGGHASFLFLIWILGAIISQSHFRLSKNIPQIWTFIAGAIFLGNFIFLKYIFSKIYLEQIYIGVLFGILLFIIKSDDNMYENKFYIKLSSNMANVSYTLYLSHLPIIVFIADIINRPWHVSSISIKAIFEFVFVIGVSVIWATILAWLFESRTDRVRRFVEHMLLGRSGPLPVDRWR